ncbi:hypothetical protein ES703_68606 [subsurface metagenome]
MAKTKYEKELEKQSLGYLVHMCAFNALAHTGSREELIARLVEAKQAEEPELEPEVEPPALEPETPAPPEETPEPVAEPEPEVETPATEPELEPEETPPAEE